MDLRIKNPWIAACFLLCSEPLLLPLLVKKSSIFSLQIINIKHAVAMFHSRIIKNTTVPLMVLFSESTRQLEEFAICIYLIPCLVDLQSMELGSKQVSSASALHVKLLSSPPYTHLCEGLPYFRRCIRHPLSPTKYLEQILSCPCNPPSPLTAHSHPPL